MTPFHTLRQQNACSTLPLYWIDPQGVLHSEAQPSTGENPAVQNPHTVIVWVPTAQVMMLSANVPGKRASEWRQALPYAFEEQLAEPVESLHFAVYHRETDGLTHCAVVSKAKMQQWVDELSAHDLKTAMLVPDCFQLPEPQTSSGVHYWNHFCQEAHCWVRTGRYAGFETQESLLPVWLEKANQSQAVVQHSLNALSFEALKQTCQQVSEHPQNWKAFDLRQGDFQAKRQRSGSPSQWGRFAFVGVLLLALYVVQQYWQAHLWEKQAQLTHQQTVKLFKQLFPDVKRIVNLSVQARQQLAKLSQNEGSTAVQPVLWLKRTQRVWLSQPQVKIERINWKRKAQNGGALSVEVTAPSMQILNALQQSLSARSQDETDQKVIFKPGKVTAKQVKGAFYVEMD